jgi:hypothetical protein
MCATFLQELLKCHPSQAPLNIAVACSSILPLPDSSSMPPAVCRDETAAAAPLRLRWCPLCSSGHKTTGAAVPAAPPHRRSHHLHHGWICSSAATPCQQLSQGGTPCWPLLVCAGHSTIPHMAVLLDPHGTCCWPRIAACIDWVQHQLMPTCQAGHHQLLACTTYATRQLDSHKANGRAGHVLHISITIKPEHDDGSALCSLRLLQVDVARLATRQPMDHATPRLCVICVKLWTWHVMVVVYALSAMPDHWFWHAMLHIWISGSPCIG